MQLGYDYAVYVACLCLAHVAPSIRRLLSVHVLAWVPTGAAFCEVPLVSYRMHLTAMNFQLFRVLHGLPAQEIVC